MMKSEDPIAVPLSTTDERSANFTGRSESTNAAGVASKNSPGLDGLTDDSRSLGLLLSFFSPSYPITHDFLLRGGSPRKRWTRDGGIEEVDATTSGLFPELTSLLSNSPRLSHALMSLATTVLRKSDQGYILDADAARRIRQGLPAEALTAWKTQALIISYRACPWKYIEPRSVSSLVSGSHDHIYSLQR